MPAGADPISSAGSMLGVRGPILKLFTCRRLSHPPLAMSYRPEPSQGRPSFASRTAFELLAPSDSSEEQKEEEVEEGQIEPVLVKAYVAP